ncbi:hypothetical protein MJH12_13225, partial [bacterium]|nr:hypothetical protein [bacterium]
MVFFLGKRFAVYFLILLLMLIGKAIHYYITIDHYKINIIKQSDSLSVLLEKTGELEAVTKAR